ncbi:hypothetical protein AUP44_05250 [Tistrella mobilis]|uniref:Uncharacterized protein n=1 Tax=Tistrella mobilis TaxID=171437 RepID=A0A162KXK7_9PROT|nr:hypothetical protein AUP44_05250 [Tistrella mobilis]
MDVEDRVPSGQCSLESSATAAFVIKLDDLRDCARQITIVDHAIMPLVDVLRLQLYIISCYVAPKERQVKSGGKRTLTFGCPETFFVYVAFATLLSFH